MCEVTVDSSVKRNPMKMMIPRISNRLLQPKFRKAKP